VPRVKELDALRGLGALSVMIYHLRPSELSFGLPRVDLFLVLSGFVVTTMILRHREAPNFATAFYARRALRIWPIYYLSLFVLVAANPYLPKPFPLDALPYYLTFTQNVPYNWSETAPAFNWYFLHTWSLAMEERFYLAWPAVVGLVGRRGLPPLCIALAIGSATARACGAHPWLLAGRCDGLALGGLLAALLFEGEASRRLRLAFGGMLLVGLAALIGSAAAIGRQRFDQPMTAVPALIILAANLFNAGLIGLIACHSGHPRLAWLRGRRLAYLGRISYGIYIYHPFPFMLIYYAADRAGLGQPYWLDAVKVAAALALAAASWEFLERPILALKERFPFRPATAGGRPAGVRGRLVGIARGPEAA
jgi:peptidoglycan/LPS O-acetylase OafA/YrhL